MALEDLEPIVLEIRVDGELAIVFDIDDAVDRIDALLSGFVSLPSREPEFKKRGSCQ